MTIDSGAGGDLLWASRGNDRPAGTLGFQRAGHDLEVHCLGSRERLLVADWYRGTEHRMERFDTAGSEVLLETRADQLVQAMAALAPPHWATLHSLLPRLKEPLAPRIAAS